MAITERELLGRWELVDTYLEGPDGERTPQLGERPKGVIHYGEDHTVIAMVARSDLSLPEGPTSDADAARAWAGFFGYLGSWRLSGSRVRHTIRLSHDPRLVGTTLERDIKRVDGTLVFSGAHPYGEPGHQAVIVWTRP